MNKDLIDFWFIKLKNCFFNECVNVINQEKSIKVEGGEYQVNKI